MIRRVQRFGWPYTVVKLGFLYVRRLDWTLDTLRHYPGARRACKRVLREFDPDITYFLGSNGLLMLPGFSPPSRTIVHIVDVMTPSFRTRAECRTLARRAGCFIAISEFTARSLTDQGVPRDRVKVVYPPVAMEPVTRLLRPAALGPRIGIVGQLIPRKGHAVLFEAASRLARRGLEFSLHVYGRGPDEATLKSQAESLGLTARTSFHGYVTDRVEIYRNLDVVVVPTRDDEALGLVAVEPGLLGLPVVAANSGGLPEAVVDGKTGLLFRRGDAADLSEKLARVLTEPGLAERLGTAARDHVAQTFGAGPCGDAFEEVIDQLIATANED
jgi:glycosyltransferase involved in cell wall biosynthesis